MKEFKELNTQEIAELTHEDIVKYIDQGINKDMINKEIDSCKNIMKRMGF